MSCFRLLLINSPHSRLNLWFLPRDARSLLSPGVRLSVTLVDCMQTAEDIVKLLSRPGSPIIRFLTPSAGTQFQGEPLQRGTKYTEVGKISDFRITKVLNIYTAKHV